MLDGSIVKVHQDAMRSCLEKSAEAIGRCVAGLTSKIHPKVDALGQLVKITLTPGQLHESQVAPDMFAGEACEYFIADKAYDIDAYFNLNFLVCFRRTFPRRGLRLVGQAQLSA